MSDEGAAPPPSAPFWARPAGCALILLAMLAPRTWIAGHFGLIADEAYYAMWSLYPGFGYFDHSPAVAWVIWAGRAIFGESPFAVRSLFLVCNLITYAALYRIGEVLTRDRRIGAVAAIGYAATPAIFLTFSVATPDGPSTMCWVLTLWAIAEFTRSRNPWWWLAAGAFAGLGLLSKYTVAFLGIGVLFYLVTSRERLAWFGRWQVAAGAILAVALFAPVLWISAHYKFDSFQFQLGRSTLEHPAFTGLDQLARFLAEEAIQLWPMLFVFMLIGVVLFFARRAGPLALPLLTSAPMAGYFLLHAVFGRVNPNWTAPLFPEFALIGAWAAVTVRPSSRWLRWPLDLLYVLQVPAGVALLFAGYVALTDWKLPIVGPLPFLSYVYGWDSLEKQVSASARAHGAKWVDIADYGLNGMVGYYGRINHDRLPVYDTRQAYRYRFRPPLSKAIKAQPHIIVRDHSAAAAPKGTTSLGTVVRRYQGKTLATYDVFLLTP